MLQRVVRSGLGLLLMACVASPCAAQAVATPVVTGVQPEVKTVVVVGRKRGLTIDQATPRLSLKAADVQAYGADSVSELLNILKSQTRSASGKPPIVLLNGHRVSGFSVLKDLPPEAVIRFDTFSEATAVTYGYAPGQMVVNIVLASDFLGRALEASQTGAIRDPGGVEALKFKHLHIGENGRFNLALNYETTDRLLESDRGVVSAAPATPFDVTGNVNSTTAGADIDAALSALAGVPVIVAGVPADPTSLTEFVPYANLPRQTNLAPWRSLIPAGEKFDASLSFGHTLFDSVEATLDGSVSGSRKRGLLGLASSSLLLPAGNPYSPFSRDVLIDRYFAEADALRQASNDWTGHAGLSLDGTLRTWQWNLIASADHTVSRNRIETGIDVTAIQSALETGSTSVNPFALMIDDLHKTVNTQNQVSDQYMVQIMTTGTVHQLSTGPLSLSANMGANGGRVTVQTFDDTPGQIDTVNQNVLNAQIGLNLPVSSKSNSLLPGLGNLNLMTWLNASQTTGFRPTHGYTYILMWVPLDRVFINVTQSRKDMPPDAVSLASNTIETPNVTVFDYVRGENAVITQVTGGNADLPMARSDNTGIDLFITPSPKIDLSLSMGLNRILMTNAAGALPPSTREAEIAFPDRYTRDASGHLIRIDARAVNYGRQQTDELRTSLTYNCAAGACSWMSVLHWPESRLSLSLNHTVRLSDTVFIRDGLPEIDRLKGGITGAGQEQQKSQLDWNLGLTSPTGGVWFSGQWRDGIRALGGTAESNLTFSKVTIANLRVFVNLGKLKRTARAPWAQGLRATLSIDNLLDDYQAARDEKGHTPLLYQRGLVDPMGRTVTLVLRKSF